jgi:hypothetical protein
LALIATTLVGIWYWHRHQAKAELRMLIKTKEAAYEPGELVSALEEYLRTHPRSDISEIATTRLEEARQELDDFDWQEACRRNGTRRTDPKAPDEDIASIEAECRRYLQLHPDGRHKVSADTRLKELGVLRDERAFQQSLELSRQDPPDFEAEQKAWQEYLDAFPAGRHTGEAKACLSKIPDRADERTFKGYETEVQELVRAGQYPQALDQVDQALLAVKAPDRQQRLRTTASEITANLEEIDWQNCMRPIPKAGHGRDKQRQACELFLLCYPESERRADIEKQLGKLGKPRQTAATQPDRRPSGQDVSPQRALVAFAALVQSQFASPAGLTPELPGEYEFKWFDEAIAVPIQWTLQAKDEANSKLSSEQSNFFTGNVALEYQATLDRVADQPARSDLYGRIDSELASLSKALSVTVVFELRGEEHLASGVGIDFEAGPRRATVARLIPGGAASETPLKAGDAIAAIDDMPVPTGVGVEQVEAMIANASSNHVDLTFVRNGRRFRLQLVKGQYKISRYGMRRLLQIRPQAAFGTPDTTTDWKPIELSL